MIDPKRWHDIAAPLAADAAQRGAEVLSEGWRRAFLVVGDIGQARLGLLLSAMQAQEVAA